MTDIQEASYPDLDWVNDQRNAAEKLKDYSIERAQSCQQWYLQNKVWKRRMGFLFRVAAMACTALSGIIPMLASVLVAADTGDPLISPVLSGVFLGLAAFLVAVDRFGGLTSGWVRYMLTAQEIAKYIDQFRFNWEGKRSHWAENTLEPEQVEEAVTFCLEFVDGINAMVLDETKAWAAEFLSNLKEIEKAAKVKNEPLLLGGINITLENGEKFSEGWSVKIDAGKKTNYHGTSASIPRLYAGLHVVRIEGTIDGVYKCIEQSVNVQAGKILELKLVVQ